ncbi:MAG TPA: hypothetical protein VFB82_02080, partial [Blastocatellia bacterium]|nr:hypothetical protein [Blastocatellia bacterium]
MKRYLTRTSITLMTLALVGLLALTALAVPRPFHLVEHGTAKVTQERDTLVLVADGMGTATQLGRFTLHREANLTPSSVESELEVNGQATLTAANGDKLEASIKGTLNTSAGHADLVYEWTGGTGRFQNASGTTIWLVELFPDGTYDVIADG